MKCRYDREANEYLIDGERCRTDEYGDPTKHCTARLTCANHIGRDELTCARCIGRTRTDVRQIVALASLMLPAAIDDGLRSQAADLAGPAADPRAVSEIRAYVQGHVHAWMHTRPDHPRHLADDRAWKILEALPDEDEWHPYSVLTRWQMMLSEDYGHPMPARLTIHGAAAYLERNLHGIAQDPEQDYALLARELRRVRSRLESALHNSRTPEKGEPCPTCKDFGHIERLVREFGHWCDDDDCEQQFHYRDESGDMWRCPRNRAHVWGQHDYEAYVEKRKIGA